MIHYLKRTWCEINLDHIQYNINRIREKAQKDVIAVVKADAYGHGDKMVCKTLAQSGIAWFAVSNIAEAVSLRKEGITQNILILGYTPPEYAKTLADYRITQTVYDSSYAELLHQELARLKLSVPVHVKIDTGMNRIGFPHHGTHSAVQDIRNLSAMQYFQLQGIFTHFCHSDSYQDEAFRYTENQADHFFRLIDALEQHGITFDMIHTQNSAGIIAHPNDRCTHVRAGIILYGLPPSNEMQADFSLRAAMSLKSIVTMVKQVDAGAQVSYGRTFTAGHPMSLATVSVGYADGYSRSFSSRADVLIRGRRCRIVGRVCMDQIVVDVTDVPGVQTGDPAVLFGTDGSESVSADELAQLAGTINYEITCSVSRRVPRIYMQDGKAIHMEDYLLGNTALYTPL